MLYQLTHDGFEWIPLTGQNYEGYCHIQLALHNFSPSHPPTPTILLFLNLDALGRTRSSAFGCSSFFAFCFVVVIELSLSDEPSLSRLRFTFHRSNLESTRRRVIVGT